MSSYFPVRGVVVSKVAGGAAATPMGETTRTRGGGHFKKLGHREKETYSSYLIFQLFHTVIHKYSYTFFSFF